MSVGRLAGKAAIVTGGGSGIGRAVCQVFAREGASVAVLDVDTKGMTETLNSMPMKNKHCMIPIDVTSADQAKESIGTAEDKLGIKSEILVNSAGIIRDNFLTKLTEKQFDEVINVNLKGIFLMTKEFVTSLREPIKGLPGSIVNISSIVGKTGNMGQTNYAASKAGVIGMTKSIALEYGKYNIRCNAVLPGFIQTPMTDLLPKEILKQLVKQIPMKRLGVPEDIADACLFLASDESSYVNGASLEVTGGLYA